MNAEVLKYLRIKKGMTQKELAERTGLTKAFISHLENKISNPSKKTEYKIAKALDVPVEHLSLSKNMQDNYKLIRLLIDCTLKDKIEWQKQISEYKGEKINVYKASSKANYEIGEINVRIERNVVTFYLKSQTGGQRYEEVEMERDNYLIEISQLIEVIENYRNIPLRQIIQNLKELKGEIVND